MLVKLLANKTFSGALTMKSNLETIHEHLESILDKLDLIPDTQDVMPETRDLNPDSPLSHLVQHWLQFWSICYPQVRNERNMARDEAKQLRSNLEAAIKESNSYKREKNELEIQISQLKKEMEKIHMMLMKHAGQFDRSNLGSLDEPDREGRLNSSPELISQSEAHKNSEDGLVTKAGGESRDLDIEEYILQGAVPKHAVELYLDKGEQVFDCLLKNIGRSR